MKLKRFPRQLNGNRNERRLSHFRKLISSLWRRAQPRSMTNRPESGLHHPADAINVSAHSNMKSRLQWCTSRRITCKYIECRRLSKACKAPGITSRGGSDQKCATCSPASIGPNQRELNTTTMSRLTSATLRTPKSIILTMDRRPISKRLTAHLISYRKSSHNAPPTMPQSFGPSFSDRLTSAWRSSSPSSYSFIGECSLSVLVVIWPQADRDPSGKLLWTLRVSLHDKRGQTCRSPISFRCR